MSWNPNALPVRNGTIAVVTGANRGLGYFISEQLARAGTHVVLACRSRQRADAALRALLRRVPDASAEIMQLDVADLASVRRASESLLGFERLDLLIENAGIVRPPATRQVSVDGNELTLATNFLGHFLLTGLAMPVLTRTADAVGEARILTLGSLASRLSSFRIDDLQLTRHYTAWRAYAQSKIAVQSFGFELDRRLRAAGSRVESVVAHPGYSISGRTPRVAGVNEPSRNARIAAALQGFVTQGKERGAWVPVRAAIDPDATGGQYWGPRFVTRGEPRLAKPTRTSTDPAIARRLWAAAEELTGRRFEV